MFEYFQKLLITVLLISLSISSSNSSNLNGKLSFSNGSKLSASNFTIDQKRLFIREIALEAWSAYSRLAWGHEDLMPVTGQVLVKSFGNHSGLTIVNSMTTLWTMGLMEEFEQGREWIREKLNFESLKLEVPVYDAITNYVGALLSCYALTGDGMFRDKAKEIALALEPAFENATGIPYQTINPKTRTRSGGISNYLSFITGFHLDYRYLSDTTGDARFRARVSQIRTTLNKLEKQQKNLLYFNKLNVISGGWENVEVDLFALGKDFYSSAIKSYVQSNLRDLKSIQTYKEALDEIEGIKMFGTSARTGLTYARRYFADTLQFQGYMEYSGCHLGAMLSLGANSMLRALGSQKIELKNLRTELNRIERHFMLAEKLTETCRTVSAQTSTGLGPDLFYMDASLNRSFGYYSLSPELAESYFVLWRLTGDSKYRDYAWELAQSIYRHCRVPGSGYSAVDNVNEIPTVKSNFQNPDFLGATLKYLYLTFSHDHLLSLDQWVFNVKGHPLPICGRNYFYPDDQCNV